MLKYSLTALVAVVLGVAGIFWYSSVGHTQVSGLFSGGTCKHHFLKADCPFCTPSLVEQNGPCKEHSVPEALCWRCNKKLISAFKLEGDWCKEHNTPESLCPVCKGGSEIEEEKSGEVSDHGELHGNHFTNNDGEAGRVGGPVIDQNALARSQREPSPTCKKTETTVRLASVEMVQRTGLGFHDLERRPVTLTVSCNAELAYDGNRFAQLSSRVPGVVREVRVDMGAKVKEGEVLAVIDSPELAAAKADYLQAIASVALHAKSYERLSGLSTSGFAAQRDVQEAENDLAEAHLAQSRAEQQLQGLGLSKEDVPKLGDSNDISSLLPLTAPFSGEIVDRTAVIGEMVDASRMLFSVSNTTRMWAMLDVSDLRAKLQIGQPVNLTIEGFEGESLQGTLTWISTRIDPKTRMLKARAEFENLDGLLKVNMFGAANIRLHEDEPTLLVPKAAVQWDGCCNVVFVKASDTVFEPRKVRLGPSHEGFFEVLSGVDAGETVVTQGSYLLKTEILKGEIGAGCCPDDH